ncbi:hypothetical protein ASD52_04830 [Ensifer sp. Root142]|nr:hypothetical protein ASD52_04830 [Ensifer sp. Root142]
MNNPRGDLQAKPYQIVNKVSVYQINNASIFFVSVWEPNMWVEGYLMPVWVAWIQCGLLTESGNQKQLATKCAIEITMQNQL